MPASSSQIRGLTKIAIPSAISGIRDLAQYRGPFRPGSSWKFEPGDSMSGRPAAQMPRLLSPEEGRPNSSETVTSVRVGLQVHSPTSPSASIVGPAARDDVLAIANCSSRTKFRTRIANRAAVKAVAVATMSFFERVRTASGNGEQNPFQTLRGPRSSEVSVEKKERNTFSITAFQHPS